MRSKMAKNALSELISVRYQVADRFQLVQGDAETQIVLFLLCDRGPTRLLGDKKPRFFFKKDSNLRAYSTALFGVGGHKILYEWFSTQSQPPTNTVKIRGTCFFFRSTLMSHHAH